MSSPIKIAQFNAAGIDKNPDELINYCIQQNIDIILLTETHLAAGRRLNTTWKQHHVFGRTPGNSRTTVDGLALLYRPDLPYHIHFHPNTSNYIISFTLGPYQFHGLYVPPSLSHTTFRNLLFQLDINDSTLVFGDLNARLGSRLGDRRTNGRAPILEEWLLHHGLHIWNETLAFGQATFEKQGVGRSIIDLFISHTSAIAAPSLEIHGNQSLSSDHHLCTLSFYPTLSVPRLPTPNAPRLHWKLQRLKEDPVRILYVEEFRRLSQPIAALLSDHRRQDHESDPEAIDNIGRMLTEAIYTALDNSVTQVVRIGRNHGNGFGPMTCKSWRIVEKKHIVDGVTHRQLWSEQEDGANMLKQETGYVRRYDKQGIGHGSNFVTQCSIKIHHPPMPLSSACVRIVALRSHFPIHKAQLLQ